MSTPPRTGWAVHDGLGGVAPKVDPVLAAIERCTDDVDVPVDVVVGIGRGISASIVSIASRQSSELLVIGWRGTVHETRFRGSVARELLRVPHQDMWVVHPSSHDGSPTEIVVGVSPGISAGAAVRAAATIVAGSGTPLRLPTVVQPDWRPARGEPLRRARGGRRPRGRPRSDRDAGAARQLCPRRPRRCRPPRVGVRGRGRARLDAPPHAAGTFADALTNRLPCTTVVVRAGDSTARSWWHELVDVVRRAGPSERDHWGRDDGPSSIDVGGATVIRITRFLQADPALVIGRFHTDPAWWLPGPITMHGAHEFHARVRGVPWTLLLTFTVSGVWEQDNAFTRHLRIAVPERQGIAMFRSVTGELTALSDPRGVRLRYRASVERIDARGAVLLPAELHARLVASRVVRLIAANLTGPPETAKPDAAGPNVS